MSVIERLAEQLRWAAFDRLRTGRPASATELAAAVGVSPSTAEAALGQLARTGLLERDPSGVIVGAQGLTRLATRHQLVLDGVELHTWCALDAIGIPAALGVNADVVTSCGWCDRTIRVRVDGGVPVADAACVLWLPTSPCANVREDFCPVANLFCEAAHLQSWRRAAGPAGEVLSLEQTAALGREWWRRSPGGCCDVEPPAGG